MALEKITSISREEAEKGLHFLRNGLPEEAVPLGGKEFVGYYCLTRDLDGKKIRLVYEPIEALFNLRNISYLE